MSKEIICLIINAVMYCLFAFFVQKKFKLTYKTFPTVIWAASSIISVLYFVNPVRVTFYGFHDKINIIPLLYLFVMVLLSFVPLLKFDSGKVRSVYINQRFYFMFSIFCIALSLITIYPNTSYFIKNMLTSDAYLNAYTEKHAGLNDEYLSESIARCMRWLKYLRGVIPILFVVSFTKYVKKNLLIRIGLAIAMLNVTINFLNSSSRYALLTDVLYLLFIYLLFSSIKAFAEDVKNRIKMVLIIIGGCFFLGVTIMTLQRFGENSGFSKGLDYVLELYAGEGFCNFAGDMWNMKETANGENCFATFIYKWNGIEKAGRDYVHLESILHRRMNVFYTFIGDYYTDFGRTYTVFFVSLITMLFMKLTQCHNLISLGKIITICMWTKILVMGITYWTYLNYTFEILGSIFAALLFSTFSMSIIKIKNTK